MHGLEGKGKSLQLLCWGPREFQGAVCYADTSMNKEDHCSSCAGDGREQAGCTGSRPVKDSKETTVSQSSV